MGDGLIDRGRFGDLEPIAIVDIGSNSVRLVVYEGAVRAPFPIYNEKVLCGLGRSFTSSGRLVPESVEQALDALRRFKAIARGLGAKNVHAIATAAVREAIDGRQFVSAAEYALGSGISVLTGEREAELAANGIKMGFVAPDGVGGDLGGGSLELINIAESRLEEAITLPLGGLRLAERARGRVSRARILADDDLESVRWLRSGRGRPFYAIGGTWRAFAKLHMQVSDAPLRVVHGYTIKRSEMIDFCNFVSNPRAASDTIAQAVLSNSRRDTLPYGAVVMRGLMETMRPRNVVFSIFGIREGLLYSYLSAAEQQRDPLLSFCEDFSRLRSRSHRHAHELCHWTDQLFQEANVDETPEERRLRHAVCLLSDIEWRAQADHRGEQALFVLAHAPFTGVDHAERLFVAIAVYFRHAGRGENRGHELSGYLRQGLKRNYLERAQLVAAAIRTAHMLSIGRPGIMGEIGVEVLDGVLHLVIPRAYADMDGERLRRRLKVLATRLGLTSAIRVDG
ncbi:MAG: exopolyphosphatase [Hyphomicrobiaceae bacterium]